MPPETAETLSSGFVFGAAPAASNGARRSRLHRWVYWLEECFRIPFTGTRFGLDALVGFFFPGVGDAVGIATGVPILLSALRRRHPWRVLLVMTVNLLLDATIGAIPLFGDVFDLFWKAQRKNLMLLEDPRAVDAILHEAKGRFVWLAIAAVLLLVAIVAVLAGVAAVADRLLRPA
jgi:hypothetical protein